jgi:hypothetical protein
MLECEFLYISSTIFQRAVTVVLESKCVIPDKQNNVIQSNMKKLSTITQFIAKVKGKKGGFWSQIGKGRREARGRKAGKG